MSAEEEKVPTEPAPEKADTSEAPKEKSEEVAAQSDAAVEEKPESDKVEAEKKEKAEEPKEEAGSGEEEEERFGTPEAGEGEGEGGEGQEGEVEGNGQEEGGEEGEGGDVEGGVEQLTLDEDQDIESPAYIPKTGKFYMHDSREDTAAEEQRDERRTRADGQWSRDRYDERYQQPRPRQHLIQKYGFDIRLGETKEMAEEKEKELREAGVEVETEEAEEPTRGGHRRGTSANRGRGQWRGPRRHDGPHGRQSGEFNQGAEQEDFPPLQPTGGNELTDEDYVAPAARRDARTDRGSSNRGGDGQRRSGDVRRHPSGGSRWRGDGGRGQGSYSGGEGGYGRQGEARTERGQGGRGYGRQGDGSGAPQRAYNRTFHNTNRGRVGARGARGAQEDNRDDGPKRYSTQRGPRTDPADPAPASGSPTDIVYFDPSQQAARGGTRAPPARERKPLDIVPPSD